MAAPQNFRSSFNGFNREDVVHYLEYLNNKHTAQVNQLTTEIEELRSRAVNDQSDLVASLQEECASLNILLEQAEAEKAQLAERCAQLEASHAPTVMLEDKKNNIALLASEELETYRRAERIEREARERAELVYFQANGVLTEATAKVDGLSAEITDMADQVMRQLTQLQMAVSSSKQALQDAASIMNTIRPNK